MYLARWYTKCLWRLTLTWSSPGLDFGQGRPHHHFQTLLLIIVPFSIYPWSDLLSLGPSVQASVFGHRHGPSTRTPCLTFYISVDHFDALSTSTLTGQEACCTTHTNSRPLLVKIMLEPNHPKLDHLALTITHHSHGARCNESNIGQAAGRAVAAATEMWRGVYLCSSVVTELH